MEMKTDKTMEQLDKLMRIAVLLKEIKNAETDNFCICDTLDDDFHIYTGIEKLAKVANCEIETVRRYQSIPNAINEYPYINVYLIYLIIFVVK